MREIAAAEGRTDRVERDALRTALYVLVTVLGIFGAAAVALAAHPLATVVFGDDALADEMRLCAIAVLATVWGSGALADLNGFRRIRSLALLQPIAALAATAGTLAVYLADMDVLPAVFDYIEVFYNRRRRHSTLAMLSPLEYETGTLRSPGASLAASRLASTNKIKFTTTTAAHAA